MSGTSSTGSGGPIDHDDGSSSDGPLTRGRIAVLAVVVLLAVLAATGMLPIQLGDLTGGGDSGLDIDGVEVTDEVVEGEQFTVAVTVNNTANETITDTVEVSVGDLATESAEIAVPAGETDTVTLEFGTETGDSDEYSIAADTGDDSDEAASIRVVTTSPELTVDIVDTASPVFAGQSLAVTVDVTNVGDRDWTGELDLNNPSGETVDNTTLTVETGTTEQVTVEWETQDDVEVTDENITASIQDSSLGVMASDSQSVDVTPPGEARFNVTGLEAPNVTVGDTLEITVEVENVGGGSGFQTIEVSAGRLGEGSTDTLLSAGESAGETFTFDTSDVMPGEYTVEVSTDDDTRTTTVGIGDASPDPPESSFTNLDIAGQGTDASVTLPSDGAVSVEVENVGDEPASFDVTLFLDDDLVATEQTRQLETGTQTVTFDDLLADRQPGNYSVTVETDDDSATGRLTVTRPDQAVFEIRSSSAEPNPVEAGEAGNFSATIENVGGVNGTATVEFEVVGTTVSRSTELTLTSGATETVTFDATIEQTGSYSYSFATGENRAEAGGQIEVTEGSTSGTLQVVGLETNSSVEEGEPLEVTATVNNTGTEDDSQRLKLTVKENERVVDTNATTVNLDGGESTTVQLAWENGVDDAGDYKITATIDDTSKSVNVTVEQSPSFDVSITGTNAPVEEGETLEVNATVENTGGTGSQDISLNVPGLGSSTRQVRLNSGATEQVTLRVQTESGDSGEYTATVASNTAQDSVLVAVGGDPNLQLRSIDAPPEVPASGTLEVGYTIENIGGGTGTEGIVALRIADVGFVDSDTDVRVESGQQVRGTLTFSDVEVFFDPGDTIEFTVELRDFEDTASGSTTVTNGTATQVPDSSGFVEDRTADGVTGQVDIDALGTATLRGPETDFAEHSTDQFPVDEREATERSE